MQRFVSIIWRLLQAHIFPILQEREGLQFSKWYDCQEDPGSDRTSTFGRVLEAITDAKDFCSNRSC